MKQTDVLEKAHAAPSGEVSQTVSIEDVKKAEAEALKAVRKPVNATAVGWKQIGEWEEKDELTLDDELMDLTTPTLLDSFIPEAAYGDWYHTVGLFIAAGLLSFIFSWFNFSLAPVFFNCLALLSTMSFGVNENPQSITATSFLGISKVLTRSILGGLVPNVSSSIQMALTKAGILSCEAKIGFTCSHTICEIEGSK